MLAFLTLLVTISTVGFCDGYSNVVITNAYRNVSNPDIRQTDRRNYIRAEFFGKHRAGFVVNPKWSIAELDPATRTFIRRIELSDLTSTVRIPNELGAGLYNFSVKFDDEDYTFVKLVQPILTVVLLANKIPKVGLNSITVTKNDVIVLRPGFASFYHGLDSNVIVERNFTKIDYYCRKLVEKYPMFDDYEIEPDKIVGPNGSSNNGMGCFGQGPGKLSFNSNSVSFPASQFNAVSEIFEFRADVHTLNGRHTGYGYVRLNEGSKTSFPVYITPRTPGVGYRYDATVLLNLKTRATFEGSFDESQNLISPIYKWTIYPFNETTDFYPLINNELSNLVDHSYGSDSNLLTIFPSFFDLHSSYSRFGLMLRIESSYKVSESMIFFRNNTPPNPGDCNVIPTAGAETDYFEITCSDWRDEDGIASYIVYATDPNEPIGNFYWTPTKAKIRLPVGLYEYDYWFSVWVNVTDSFGVTTVLFATDVRVLPSKITFTWTFAETKALISNRNYIQIAPLLSNFATFLKNSTQLLDDETCSRYCESSDTVENCVISRKPDDCKASKDSDTILRCQESEYTCLDENDSRCLVCVNATSQTCALLSDFNCHYFNYDKTCKYAILNSRDVLKQISKLLSTINEMEITKSADVEMQVQLAVELVESCDFILNLAGLETLVKLYDKFTIAYNSFRLYENPDEIDRLYRSLLTLAGNMIKALNKSLKNPTIADRIKASAALMSNFDSTLQSDSSDFVDYESLTPKEFGYAAYRRYSKDMASKVMPLAQQLISDNASNLIESMKDGDFYRVTSMNGDLEISIWKKQAATLLPEDRNSFDGKNYKIVLPKYCKLINTSSGCNDKTTVALFVASFKDNIFKQYDKENALTAGSLEIYLMDTKTYKIIPIDQSQGVIDIYQKSARSESDAPSLNSDDSNNPMDYHSLMKYYQIVYNVTDSVLVIKVSWEDPTITFMLTGDLGKTPGPLSGDYTFSKNLTKSPHYVAVPSSTFRDFLGIVQIGIAQYDNYKNSTSQFSGYLSAGDSVSHSLETYLLTCRYLNSANFWSTSGCKVGTEGSSVDEVHCQCTHLSTFSSGVLFPATSPKIGSYDFAQSYRKNTTIFITVLVIFCLWFIVIVWAHVKDQRDLAKLGVIPLLDNNPCHRYLYEIIISTGFCLEAATDSKVYFMLAGTEDETEIRYITSNSVQPLFRRGDVNQFLMSTPRSLGDLTFLRMWHDNSGRGQYASWFVNHVTFVDLQTRKHYQFIVDRWLAVEKDNGRIDFTARIARMEQRTALGFLFPNYFRRIFMDHHLWLSIFTRPPNSKFTRVQRTCCCLGLLYSSLLVSGLWYNWLVDSVVNTNLTSFGPLSLSIHEVLVGFFAPLFVFPFNLMIVVLFRRSRRRKSPAIKIREQIEKKLEEYAVSEARKNVDYSYGAQDGGVNLNSNRHGRVADVDDFVEPGYAMATEFRRPANDNCLHPVFAWYFVVIAWTAWFLLSVGSLFTVVYFAISFDDYMTRRWAAAFFVSLISCVFITQPVKALVLTVIYACFVRKPITDESDDHEIYISANSEQYLYNPSSPPRHFDPQIYDAQYLAHCREKRLKELKMYDIIREALVYFGFVVVVLCIIRFNRSHWQPLQTRELTKLFVGSPEDVVSMRKVKTADDFWQWAELKLAPALRAPMWYNGMAPMGQGGFLADRTSRIIGFATMRQIRTKQTGCIVLLPMTSSYMLDCYASSVSNEDTESYDYKWTDPTGDQNPSEFSYQPAEILEYPRTSGIVDSYSGGGYVVNLVWSVDETKAKFAQLRDQLWIDRRTRAVAIEFSVYNPNLNLFSTVRLLFEFPPSSGVVSSWSIKSMTFSHPDRWPAIKVVCEIAFCIFVFVFTLKECRNFYRQGFLEYFTKFWNYVELSLTVHSYVAFVTYFVILFMQKSVNSVLEETNGNAFVNLHNLTVWQDFFNKLLAFISFFAVIKFAKLLRFNFYLSLILDALRTLSSALIWFAFMMVVTFVAYRSFFYLSTYWVIEAIDKTSTNGYVPTAMSTFFGELNAKAFSKNGNTFLGPIFYFVYAFTTSMILINLGISLLLNATKSLRRNVVNRSRDYELLDRMFDKCRMTLFGKRRRHERMPVADHWTDVSMIAALENRVDMLYAKVRKLSLRDDDRQPLVNRMESVEEY